MTDQRHGSQLADIQAAIAEKRGRKWAFPNFDGKRTAMIGCEVSRLGLSIAPKLRGAIPRIDWLARTLRASGGSVFWSHFAPSAFDGTAGAILGDAEVNTLRTRLGDEAWIQVNEGVQDIDGDRIVSRPGYAAVGNELRKILKAENIDTLILAGAETDGAIDSTARAAASAGLKVVVVSDCCVSSDESAHIGALIALHRRIADVRPADEIVAELRRNIAG